MTTFNHTYQGHHVTIHIDGTEKRASWWYQLEGEDRPHKMDGRPLDEDTVRAEAIADFENLIRRRTKA